MGIPYQLTINATFYADDMRDAFVELAKYCLMRATSGAELPDSYDDGMVSIQPVDEAPHADA